VAITLPRLHAWGTASSLCPFCFSAQLPSDGE
jgi:hypothetical protein